MNYPEFETAFEAQFQKHTVSYPHAVEYHRARFNQTIQYLLSSILEQADTLIQQPETNWAHTEEIVSDILYCGEITVEQLFALEIPNQLTADRDFETVKTKLYETKYYPISEHLNYIAFPHPEAGLSEAMRVLKPGGYLITALPVQLPLLMHLYDFDSPDEVLTLYEKVGLKVIDFETKEFQRQSDSFIDTFALSVKP